MHEDVVGVGVELPHVWVFRGEEARLASGVFTDRDTALQWVGRHQLTGVITQYPLGVGCYDLALAEGSFYPSKSHRAAGFSPSGHHIHVLDGHPE